MDSTRARRKSTILTQLNYGFDRMTKEIHKVGCYKLVSKDLPKHSDFIFLLFRVTEDVGDREISCRTLFVPGRKVGQDFHPVPGRCTLFLRFLLLVLPSRGKVRFYERSLFVLTV